MDDALAADEADHTPRLGPVGRARASVAALRVLTTLEQERRTATDREREVLAGWSGWGPLAKALEEKRSGTWVDIGEELRELLTPSQLLSGLEACTNSFYTPPEITQACWDILTGLGFTGGRILEPGCGSGRFISSTPSEVQAQWLGVESDQISAAIARHLHPEAMILATPMEQANLPGNCADAVIGNVPFEEVPVFDPAAPVEVTRTLHDYMLWSSVQALAPGGIAVLVTSCGTLDKVDGAARRALDTEAALIGAIRLPNGAFGSAGTEAATDILVLRRRTGQEPQRNFSAPLPTPEQLPEDALLASLAQGTWTELGEGMNKWLTDFPEAVLGTVGTHAYRTGQITVTPDEANPWPQSLRSAVATTVERARTAEMTSQVMQAPESLADTLAPAENGLKEGRILTVEREVTTRGRTRTVPVIAQVVEGQIEEVRTTPPKPKKGEEPKEGNLKPATKELFALIELRDAALELFEADADLENVSDAELAPIRERVLNLYQAYHDTYGPIGRATVSYTTKVDEETGVEELVEKRTAVDLGGMRDDVDMATLLALENYDIGSNTATPADILYRRINAPSEATTYADSPHEAVAISLDATNRVDPEHISTLLGIPVDQVEATLTTAHAAFRDPEDPDGDLVPAFTYLSGAIGHKLELARKAAEDDDTYTVNVQALEDARPEPLPPEKIEARLGAPWIPAEVIEEFARQVLEIRVKVSTYRATGDWVVKVPDSAKNTRMAVANCEQWAYTPPPPKKSDPELYLVGYGPLSPEPGEEPQNQGPLRRGDELLLSALNNRSPEIRYYVDDEKTARHDKFSRDADKVQERLQRAFSTWVWQDPERARKVAEAFNRDFQSTVPPNPSGAHLTFPGMSGVIEPYSHQLEFVAMALGRKAAACIHDMGGGKTATMFMTAIKHVQLGLASNPIIVVPNGLLDDITRQGKQLFPSARILMATERDMRGPEARRRFARKCAANRWDAIVMTESMYSRIPVHPKTEAEFHEKYKAELAATYSADTKDSDGAQAKRIAKKIKARSARAKALLSQTGADKDTTYLEHFGSNLVCYDEASDWMRNLGEWVQVEGIPMSKPVNAAQGFLKAMTVQMRGGKAFLFTGTPMVRNILDLYSIMLTVNREGLIARGIYNAEQFARTFIRMETVLEPTADGQGVKLRRRVREPLNQEQLRTLFGEGAHIRMNLQLDLPELVQHVHTVEATPTLREFASELAYRESQIKGWRQAKGDDTYFSLVALGRAAALDPVLAGLPEDGPGKLDMMADTIGKRYHETKELRFPDDPPGVQGALQLVFINQGVPHGKNPRTYGRMRDKLIAQGIPRERIALVHDHDKPAQRARLYEACRAGKYSVLIGSFPKMGYGVNVQDRLSDIHIADVGWNPADLRQAIKRGYRKGNLNSHVNVHLYPVTHSVDARFFALNEQRRVVEEAFLSGGKAHEGGTMGEIAASDLGSLSAIAADNPRLTELQNLKGTLEDLEDAAAMHESNLARFSARITEGNLRIERLRTEAATLAPLTGIVQAAPDRLLRSPDPDATPLKEGDVHERLNQLVRQVIDRQRTHETPAALTYRGLSVSVAWNPPDNGAPAYITAQIGHQDHPTAVHRVQVKEAWTRKGQTFRITRAIVDAIDDLPRYLDGLHEETTDLSESNDRFRQMLDTPFADAEQLASLRTEVEVLEEELAREDQDLAERAAKVEELALTEVVPVLSDTEEGGEVRVGYDRQGQMALDVDVDHVRLVRPPQGWTETAAPGLTRTGRAVHGIHWQLTHHDSPVPSPLPFTAHIASTLEGLVRARVDVVHQHGTRRGVERTVLDGLHATYADALLSVRTFLAVDIRDMAKEDLPQEMRYSLRDTAFRLHEPVPPLERTWWSTDIERLSRTTPGTLLHAGMTEAGHIVPTRTHLSTDAQLRDFNGRFCLIRLTTGPIHAIDLVVDERGYARLDGETPVEPQLIAEVMDLGRSLLPGTAPRYLAPGQEPVLTADLVWSAINHPGDALDEGSRSLNRHLKGSSGLNAVGKKVECTIDRSALGRPTADTGQHVTVHGRLVEVDDATMTLHLGLHEHLGGTSHEQPLVQGDALRRWEVMTGQKVDSKDGKGHQRLLKPFPLRIPLSAVSSMRAAGRTWKRADAEAVRAKAQERKARAERTTVSAPVESAPPEMTPERLAEHVRALAEDLAGYHETTDTALTKASTLLESDHPDPLAASRHTLAAALVAAADAESNHPALVEVVHHVAEGLAQSGEPALAVRLRQLYLDQAPDPNQWKRQLAVEAHAWASTRSEPEDDVPVAAAELLRQDPQEWPRTGAGFNAAATALSNLLDRGLYAHAYRMREALRQTFPGRTDDWRMKTLLTRFDTMATAAAHIDAATKADPSQNRPLQVPFPHGLGVLWGHDVVVLDREGQTHLCRVEAINSRSALVADDGRIWGVHQISQVRTTDNRFMLLSHGQPADLEEALASWGEQWRAERTAYLQPFRDALTPWLGVHVQVLGSRSVLAEGVLEELTPVGVRLTTADDITVSVMFEDIGAVDPRGGVRWWVDPDRNRVEQHRAAAEYALSTADHPQARRHLAVAADLQRHVTDVPVVHIERWKADHDRLLSQANNPVDEHGRPLVQMERSGPQGRTVRIYGTQSLPSTAQVALAGLMGAEPALTWSGQENAYTADPRWQAVMIDARLEQLRQALNTAGIAHTTVTVDHPEPELSLLPAGAAAPEPTSSQPQQPDPVPAGAVKPAQDAPHTASALLPDTPQEKETGDETETPPAQPPAPDPEPVQLSARPELRTLDFHGANQAIKEALKRGDLATAQRIHEFRIDPREGGVPNAAQQPGHELFVELANAVRNAPTVDEAVFRVFYRAREADLKHGKPDEALRLLTLAEEISPEDGQHMATLRQVRSNLQVREAERKEPPQEAEEAVPSPEPAPAPTPADEPDGLFAVQPQAPTAEDVQRALDNVAAIPNPVGVFNAGQTQLIARARRANARGNTAEAAAALTHPWMKEGKAASKLQAAVGHLVRFAPANEDSDVSGRGVQDQPTTGGTSEGEEPAQQKEDGPVLIDNPPPGGWTEADRVKPITPAEFTPAPNTDPAERAIAAIEGIGDTVPLRQEHRTFWDGLEQALVDLREQGRHQEVIDLVTRVREQNHHDWWRWEPHRSRAVAAVDPTVVDRALVMHHARTDDGKAETHLYGVTEHDKDLHRVLKGSPLNLNHKISEERWQVNPAWGWVRHEERVRGLIKALDARGIAYLDQKVHTELRQQHTSPPTAEAEQPAENLVVTRAREALQAMQERLGVQTRAKAHTRLQLVADEVEAGRLDRDTALDLFGEYARIDPTMAFTVEADRARVALPTDQAPGFAEALVITHTSDQVQVRTPQPLSEKVHALLLEHDFTTSDRSHYDLPQPWAPTKRRTHLGQLVSALNDLPEAPERMPAEHYEQALIRAQGGEHAVEADQALRMLRTEPGIHARERFTALLEAMVASQEHTEVLRLVHEGNQADPAGWWERASLLSTARFANDPEGLAGAVRIDYDGAKSTIVRITGDDSDRPVRDLLKDKSRSYYARYDGKAKQWKINRPRSGVEQYRELLFDLVEDLNDLGRDWVTEQVHTELSQRHQDQAAAAMGGETVAPVNADGHVGELADVLTYPALRVGAVIRHKDANGEPRDSWTVLYDTGQGTDLTEYVTKEPTVRRGQVLTDVQVKIHDHTFSAQGDARTVIIRIPPRQERKFPLTPEQEQIRASALDGQKIVVQAGAGTGKTATMSVVAESLAEQGRRGIYVVYGRANADEAAVKLAHVPVAANTIHAFARRAVGGPYQDRINGDKMPNWRETARALGLRSMELPSGQPLDGEDLARLVDRTVQAFELSADLALTTGHIPHLPGLSDRDHGQVKRVLEPVLDRAWADMCDPAGHLFRFRHDTYVKIWQLTPGGPQMRIGGQEQPYLLVDEAQDMNPVAEAILQAQAHMQQIWVGDSAQAIHGWRGAKDALINQQPDVELTLTHSFRFGEAVAAEANGWLGAIDAPLRVKGTPSLDTVVHDRTVEAPDAVLARTNAGVFNAALAQLQAGRRVAIVGGTDELTRLVDAADKLQSDKRTTHPDLSHFRSWGQVVKCALDRPEDLGSLAPFVRLVEKLGTSAVRDALSQMTDTDPEVEVCTAHKSKGLEWDRVQIADDFAPKENQRWSAEEFKAEAQLAYVAITRARRELGRGSLAYIDEYTGTASAKKAAEEAVLDQTPEKAQAADETHDAAPDPTESKTPAQEPQNAPSSADKDEATKATVAEGTDSGPLQEEERDGLFPVQQQNEPSAPADVDPKEAFDHGWVPYIPFHGELEQGPGLDRVRELAASLPPKLLRAMDRFTGESGPNRKSLDWKSTPPKHMYELQQLEIVFQERGRWWFTHLGEAVHNLLWRHKYGAEKDLPIAAAPALADASTPAQQPQAEEEPQPSLFDAAPDSAPAPQGEEEAPAQPPMTVEEEPKVSEAPEPMGPPEPEEDIRQYLESQDELWSQVRQADGGWVYAIGAPGPDQQRYSPEEFRERFLASDPAADEPAVAEQDRAFFDAIADAEDVDGTTAPQEVPEPGEAQPRPADATGPAREAHTPSGLDPELDTEANRTRASRGHGPLRRGKLTLELADEPQGREEERERRQATIEVGGPAPSPGAAEPSQNDGSARSAEHVREIDPAPRQAAGQGPVVISGHQLRAADKRWQRLLDTQGRQAARQAVDPSVYDKMRRQFRAALSADKDVHLVMPSNDPTMVKEFIGMAREYGYEITLKAAIPPNPLRTLNMVEHLHDQLLRGTPYRAMGAEESKQEHQNLRQILTDAHNEHLADRVELYPRSGVTTDTTPVIRDHLIGPPDNPRWSLGTPIKEHINALEKADVTPEENQRIRTRVAEMAKDVRPDDQVPEHQRWAHEQLKDGLNYLARTDAEPQPFKDEARRTTVAVGEEEAAAHFAGPEPPPEDAPPPPEDDDLPVGEEHTRADKGEREPAMAGAPSREDALAAARAPKTARRPPASPKPGAGVPGSKAGAASRVRHGPRQ